MRKIFVKVLLTLLHRKVICDGIISITAIYISFIILWGKQVLENKNFTLIYIFINPEVN